MPKTITTPVQINTGGLEQQMGGTNQALAALVASIMQNARGGGGALAPPPQRQGPTIGEQIGTGITRGIERGTLSAAEKASFGEQQRSNKAQEGIAGRQLDLNKAQGERTAKETERFNQAQEAARENERQDRLAAERQRAQMEKYGVLHTAYTAKIANMTAEYNAGIAQLNDIVKTGADPASYAALRDNLVGLKADIMRHQGVADNTIAAISGSLSRKYGGEAPNMGDVLGLDGPIDQRALGSDGKPLANMPHVQAGLGQLAIYQQHLDAAMRIEKLTRQAGSSVEASLTLGRVAGAEERKRLDYMKKAFENEQTLTGLVQSADTTLDRVRTGIPTAANAVFGTVSAFVRGQKTGVIPSDKTLETDLFVGAFMRDLGVGALLKDATDLEIIEPGPGAASAPDKLGFKSPVKAISASVLANTLREGASALRNGVDAVTGQNASEQSRAKVAAGYQKGERNLAVDLPDIPDAELVKALMDPSVQANVDQIASRMEELAVAIESSPAGRASAGWRLATGTNVPRFLTDEAGKQTPNPEYGRGPTARIMENFEKTGNLVQATMQAFKYELDASPEMAEALYLLQRQTGIDYPKFGTPVNRPATKTTLATEPFGTPEENIRRQQAAAFASGMAD